ncbi:serine/threonine-protein kinase ATG1a-like isoform X2 [Triticum urartu]|uniref:serine/threonine-protein kinase ATG1a-like isoform X2 n=1 Tax=Triticum dicoccoides TaxID=85692 RepID=UPI00188E074C|nr:serine/threonine-protein kinase ATG1a-like isoform X2 [Triticum dicoccoides]XP_048532752.1 serine/threonine-protein kinase ATG1a-like isoform X2 [Triticum urartu]
MEEERAAPPRVVGEYELGEMVGKGTFAEVFRAVHAPTGARVAVKEIDRRRVDDHVRRGILQEMSILGSLSHPNILRLINTIETGEKLFLVLEYCDGGDLEAYRQTHGGPRNRLPEATARDFARQLAEGLKVLRGQRIVHRDLKPQNLLLSADGDAITLKIGDFGFARSLMHENLAATFCGSPYYMAPEIWRGDKYDAKADLWSVGVILFQLVTGELPFLGENRVELREKVLSSSGLSFPPDIEADLHPEFIDLCRRLICLDPAERMPFEEFFNHNFLATASEIVDESHHALDLRDTCQTVSSAVVKVKSESVDSKVFDSWEWIEREYVLVQANTTSMELLSSLEKPMKDVTGARPRCDDISTISGPVQSQNRDSLYRLKSHGCTPLSASRESTTMENLRGRPLDCYTRLHLLNQYIVILTELAQEKLFKGLDLEALSLELVILAIWKEALNACSLLPDALDDGSFSTFAHENYFPKSDQRLSPNVAHGLDFTRPASVRYWVESGFIKAYDRAEKISHRLRENNDNTEMPDAMEIIFQTALVYGKSGATKELLGCQSRSMALYSKAIILLTFILQEATALPLNPVFSLSPFNQQRIHRYITNLRSHLCSAQLSGQQQRSIKN